MNHIILEKFHNAKIRCTDDDRFAVYDLIKVCGQKKGHYKVWKRLTQSYPEVLTKCQDFQFEGKGQRKTPVVDKEGALYILGLLPGAIGTAYREEVAKLVVRYLEGDSDLALEILYRDHNKERFERAKRRMAVTETNKEVRKLVESTPGTRYCDVHNDRYRGLYQKTAAQLRAECGAGEKETPLNYMSEIDLTMNSLVNQIAIKKGNPGAIYPAATNMREYYEHETGETLESPGWIPKCLSPSQARKEIDSMQLELPLFPETKEA